MKTCYGGIDLGGSFIKAGLISKDGARISKFEIPSGANINRDSVKRNLKVAADGLIEIAKQKKLKLSGLGIGSPGTVKYPGGIVTDSTPNIPGWIGTNISKVFNSNKFPIKCDNDANCMALGESIYGAAKGTSSGFYVTIGTGIGGAIIENGQLIRGSTFASGEFGHMVLKAGGRKCKAGHKGCVESYTAVPALILAAKKYAKEFKKSKLNKEKITTFEIFDAFKKGDRAAKKAVDENAFLLGTAIGSIVNFLNPEIIVIGGGLSSSSDKYIGLIKKYIFEFAYEIATKKLKVKKAEFGNDAGWIGAACLNIGKS
jgi:glucokinase